MRNTKQVVAGLGEIGTPMSTLLSKADHVVGYDIQEKLMDKKNFLKYHNLPTSFLHVCIPFTKNFVSNVISLNRKFEPKCIVIHSTVSPGTTKKIQSLVRIPVIYSATRGVHKRMLSDLKRYLKFYAVSPDVPNAEWASDTYANLLKKCNVKTKRMSKPITLELAKIIVDTSYY